MKMPRIAAAIGPLLLLLCARDPNPFTSANARAVIAEREFQTEQEGGTVEIFSTQELGIVVAVRELVDSFYVIIPGNRLGGDTACVRAGGPEPLEAITYEIPFSLTDTGRIDITVITFRRSGESAVTDQLRILARSPLTPLPVQGNLEERISLRTAPVQDQDVWYHWRFGSYPEVSTPSAQTDTALTDANPIVGQGMLWVSDVQDRHVSPAVPFAYTLGDLLPPLIEPVSGVVRGDTVASGDTLFTFAVRVLDQGQGIVEYVSMNDLPAVRLGTNVYSRAFRLGSAAVPVIVVAQDRSRNRSQRRFYLEYDSSVESGAAMALRIISPSRDSQIVSEPALTVLGTVERYGSVGDSLIMKISVNGVTHPDSRVVGNNQIWHWDIALADSVSRVNIAAFNRSGRKLRDTSLVVFYRRQYTDRQPPVIADVNVNGISSPEPVTNRDIAIVRIIAFDEGSGIELLTLSSGSRLTGAKKLSPASAGERYLWLDTLALTETRTPLIVYARDRDSNVSTRGVTVVLNHAPVLTLPVYSQIATAGVLFREMLHVDDPDGDSVHAEIMSGPEGMTVAGLVISWTPRPEQVGPHSVVIRLSDGAEYTTLTFELEVVPGQNAPCSLSVTLRDSLVHDSVGVGTAPEVLVFTIHDDDGVRNERYTIRIASGGTELIKGIDTARTFEVSVNPLPEGVSRDTLRVIVEDRGGNRDTVELPIVRSRQPTSGGIVLRRMRVNTTASNAGAGIAQPVLKFPLLVRIDSLASIYVAMAGQGGIIFRKANGTELPYDFDGWDPVTGTCWFWVLVDTIHANDSTRQLELCWDRQRPLISPAPRQVFDTANGFRMVYHLDSSAAGTGASAVYRNSAQSVYHGGDYVSAASGSGLVSRSAGFDGVDDYIDLGTPDIKGTGLTISCWVKANSFGYDPRLVSKTSGTPLEQHFWLLGLDDDEDSPARCRLRFRLNAGGFASELSTSTLPVQVNVWTYAVARYDGSSIRLYSYSGQPGDGISGSQTKTGQIGVDPAVRAWVGGNPPDPYSRPFHGLIDEVRIESAARSEAWIKLCYETQKPGSKVVRVQTVSSTIPGP